MQNRTEEEIRALQQEKNNNDFMYQTSKKLQDLSFGLSALSLNLDKTKSKCESDKKSLEIRMENLSEKVENEVDSTGHIIGDFATSMINLTTGVEKKFNSIELRLIQFEESSKVWLSLIEKIDQVERKLEKERAYVDSALLTLKGEINEQSSLIRKDLTPVIPKSDPIKDALEERLTPIQIDFKGLVKEIEILKKAVKYSEKKFENIYTLIERLKKGSSQ